METKDVLTALSALAHETRLAIFRLLVETGPDGLPVGKIVERLGAAPATLSFHLKELANADLGSPARCGGCMWGQDHYKLGPVMGSRHWAVSPSASKSDSAPQWPTGRSGSTHRAAQTRGRSRPQWC